MHSESLIFKSIAWYGNKLQHRGNYRVASWLRQVTNADIDSELTVERGKLKWSLNPSDFVHQDVFWHGRKDRWDMWHLQRLLPVDALIVDIGSNFGYYALHLAHTLGSGARAIAFEPMPHNFARLLRNIALNGLEDRVTAVQIGLSNVAGKASMTARKGNSGSAQIRGDGTGEITIALETLDGIWAGIAGPRAKVDFVKIDVEGHEIAALSGARDVLERCRPAVLLEVDPPRLSEAGSSPRDLQRFFDGLGYRYFVSERTKLRETSLEEAPELVNVFCLPAPPRSAILV